MNEANFLKVLEAIDEPFLLIDSQRNVVEANDPARRVLDHSLVGSSLLRVVRHPGVLSVVADVLEGNDRATAIVRLDTPHPTTYRVSAVSIEGVEGAVAAIMLRDISPVIEAEQMRTDFVANVSHELRSPLTTLSGLIETLQGSAKNDPQARERFLAVMQREAGRMDRLIDDLLSLSRLESEARIRPADKVDIVKIAEAAVGTFSDRGNSDGHTYVLNPTKSSAFVAGDADQVMQVMQNLLENAAKYSKPDGTVSVSIAERDDVAGIPGKSIAVCIADEGEGIAAEHLPRLTERFYRVDSGRSRSMGGTGLGLAIVKHIVSRHRGRLSIKSEVGTGTQVTVLLPAVSPDPAGQA